MCSGSFLQRLMKMAGGVLLVSLVIFVWIVVRMCIRSTRAKVFFVGFKVDVKSGVAGGRCGCVGRVE